MQQAQMANDNLKNALQNAGLTPEEFADIIGVDPKSVQRWLAGTSTPYPRHRATIARALDMHEDDLWPPDPSRSDQRDEPAVGDITGAWGSGSDPGAPEPDSFLDDIAQRIDLLDDHGTLLGTPGLVDALRDQARDGCEVHVLAATPSAELQSLIGVEGIQLRVGNARSAPALLRADDAMLLTIPLADPGPPPILTLHRHNDAGLFDRLADHFETLWDDARPVTDQRQLIAPQSAPDSPGQALREHPARSPEREAGANSATPSAGEPPRRWPRRPS
jgi:transcriptional regulator with XRE-family HTH domain